MFSLHGHREQFDKRMLNLKDQKVNKKYPSICLLKQNKESLAVFKLDWVAFILSAACIFYSSGLSGQLYPSATFVENHRVKTYVCNWMHPCFFTWWNRYAWDRFMHSAPLLWGRAVSSHSQHLLTFSAEAFMTGLGDISETWIQDVI